MLLLVVVAKAMARCGIRLHTNMVYQWLCVVIDCNISWLKLDISMDRGFYKWYARNVVLCCCSGGIC